MTFTSSSAKGNEWTGNVWIQDEWTDQDTARAIERLNVARTSATVNIVASESNASSEGNVDVTSTPATPQQLEEQQQALMTQFRRNAATNWSTFYQQNTNKFFKDRHYLHKAFPSEFGWLYPGYMSDVDGDGGGDGDGTTNDLQPAVNEYTKKDVSTIVEIGCGVGNAILPLLEQHTELMNQHNKRPTTETSMTPPPQLHIHCLDFAPTAVHLLKEDERFKAAAREGRATGHVYDLSSMHPSTISLSPDGQTLANSADVAILLFCLSAIGPHPSPALTRAAQHAMSMLKPGGVLVFRDYGRLDEAQLKLGRGDNELGDNFYRKGDGTGCYYFELDDLRELFGNKDGRSDKLNVLELDYIQRVYRNRGDGTTRRRVWVEGRFQKPFNSVSCSSEAMHQERLKKFLNTSVQRWNDYYKLMPPKFPDPLVSLSSITINSHHANSLCYSFDFMPWQTLLQPNAGTNGARTNKKQKQQAEASVTSTVASPSEVTIVDLGCGLGHDTLLNLIANQQMKYNKEFVAETSTEYHPKAHVHFLDASVEAIQQLHKDPRYQYATRPTDGEAACITSEVYDFTTSESTLVDTTLASSVDIAVCFYTLSTIGPYSTPNMKTSVQNIAKLMKSGGILLFRDFGRYDYEQLQLNSCTGSRIADNFYIRGLDNDEKDCTDKTIILSDAKGTGCYFFDLEEVRDLFIDAGFEVMSLRYVTRIFSKKGNSPKHLRENGVVAKTRVLVHGRFRKV